jgi:DUF4097 and DUF4098 domain-containing protein YvlB
MRRVLLAVLVAVVAAVPALSQSGFEWSGQVAQGKTLEIKGVNGNIRAELASGAQVEVRATKRAKRSNINSVTIETVQQDGNVTICAVYPTPRNRFRRDDGRPNECVAGEGGRMRTNNNDVVVDFVVRVPAGVRFVGKTVNGSVAAQGLKSVADIRTVNGRILLSTSEVGSAETVNGAIDASLGSANWTGRLDFTTVNGSITLRLPKDTSTNLHARMLNGGFQTDFPLMVQSLGRRNRRVEGVIGAGGRDLDLETVNGGIRLRFVP